MTALNQGYYDPAALTALAQAVGLQGLPGTGDAIEAKERKAG